MLVEKRAVLEALVELAGHAVEQVPLGGCVPVSVLVSAPAVAGLGTG
ncbi:hypothetical protein [Streptomyces griseomycini]|uniref:Uncharacterized protein n=1 Tax=Streptomyces griseomycini TaxID=66895 RepID=A0A7W7VAV3_9ACTN|nr:hypothetical protein [Streptomyces griseomycini]